MIGMANIQELNTTAAFDQFVADIRAGKDIDFRQYLHKDIRKQYQIVLIERGIGAEECVEFAITDDDSFILEHAIGHGYGKKHYDEWAHGNNERIRRALAEYGYKPELFLKDPSPEVRASILRAHPQYAKYFFDAKTEKELRAVMWTYLPLSEPNYDEVRELLENPYIDECWDLHGYRDVLLHKLDTQHIQLSTLEKTMSITQLFMAKSEGWKRLVNAIELGELLNFEKRLRNHPNCENILTTYLQNDMELQSLLN